MSKITRLVAAVSPLVVFTLLVLFLWQGIYAHASERSSQSIGKPMPKFSVTNVLSPPQVINNQTFKGKVSVLTVWATWCFACSIEHSTLLAMKHKYHIAIYGINYKDTPQKILKYLADNGNPYDADGADPRGEIAMDFGVYATPSTYIINKEGRIVYSQVGIISERKWERELIPMIKMLQKS